MKSIGMENPIHIPIVKSISSMRVETIIEKMLACFVFIRINLF
jgi:hypothetical protein